MKLKRKHKAYMILGFVLSIWFYFCLPKKLFEAEYSTVLNAENGTLLAAQIATDGQWRFPLIESVPSPLEHSILQFEDEYFYYHLGVNPIAMGRAIYQNIKEGRIVSGGSTISMQVIRLARNNQKRTLLEKLYEFVLATRLELRYSKKEILRYYVTHAPYGGNVVGAETAAWRYFGRSIDDLSWAEYATLAVLPNAPRLIRPGKNMELLEAKRNRLLSKLLKKGMLDSTSYELAKLEKIPNKPLPIPRLGFHAMHEAIKQGKGHQRIKSTIDAYQQQQVQQKINNYLKVLKSNQVNNACAMIVDIVTGEVKAYVGNSSLPDSPSQFVDIIQASRSSGSILKPFLYDAAIRKGMIHPKTLIKDIPMQFGEFAPANFDKSFHGIIPAGKALSKSLNIPATDLLYQYGLVPFHQDLNNLGFSTITQPVNHYGLTLILGGAEVKLWDVANAYRSQAYLLGLANERFNKLPKEFPSIHLWSAHGKRSKINDFDAGSWWLISEALKELERPGIEHSWRQFNSSKKIAWKTGTSFGFRDAWAVGYNSEHLVAVWVGNATGEGRPGLTGTSTAGPLLFNIFNGLKNNNWFDKPFRNLKQVNLCETSGLYPSENCPLENEWQTKIVDALPVCKHHQKILTNQQGERIYRNCHVDGLAKMKTWFVIDPITTFYYKKKNPLFKRLPQLAASCKNLTDNQLAIVYPKHRANIIMPMDLNGEMEQIVLQATHQDKDQVIYWHLDDAYIGQTTKKHRLSMEIKSGQHTLSILDQLGNRNSIRFQVN